MVTKHRSQLTTQLWSSATSPAAKPHNLNPKLIGPEDICVAAIDIIRQAMINESESRAVPVSDSFTSHGRHMTLMYNIFALITADSTHSTDIRCYDNL